MHTNILQLDEAQQQKLINKMTVDQLEAVKEEIAGRRCPKIRQLIQDRYRTLRHIDRIYSLFVHIDTIHGRVRYIHEQPDTHEYIVRHGRAIANDLHDLPFVFSGYESEASIEASHVAKKAGRKYEPCFDHFHPRLLTGIRIVKHIHTLKHDFSHAILTKMLYEFSHVHKVTSEENTRLRPFQRIDTFVSPEDAYSKANIKLVQVKDFEPHKVYLDLIDLLTVSPNKKLSFIRAIA